MNDDELKAARAVAFRFLGHSARSCMEIERRLMRGGFDDDVTAILLSELQRDGYVDDDKFASDWILDRADRKRYGRTRLAAELTQRGVDRETVSQVIGEVTEEDEIRRALETAEVKSPVSSSLHQDRKEMYELNYKLSQYLLRRGFNHQVVKQVLALREENRKELS